MNAHTSRSNDQPTAPSTEALPAHVGVLSRFAAVVEVVAAFAAVHVMYRAIKQFTTWGRLEAAEGLNYTPGLVMIAFTVIVLLACRRSFAEYGLTFKYGVPDFKLGLLCGLVIVAVASLLRLLGVQHEAGGPPPSITEGVAYGVACLTGIWLLACLLRNREGIANRMLATVCVVLMAIILALSPTLAWRFDYSVLEAVLTVGWLVIGAGIGEEVFFRGYIQSRINVAFGQPCRWEGMTFGAGLLISSLMFGFLHVLNTVDYFHGQWTFAWGFGLTALGTGLLFGCLRENTGSIVAGAVTHSVLDVLGQLPKWMQ